MTDRLFRDLLNEIEKFNEKNTDFDDAFQMVVEGVRAVQSGVAEVMAAKGTRQDLRGRFEEARGYLAGAKEMLAGEAGYSAPLKQLVERYSRFCDRLLSDL